MAVFVGNGCSHLSSPALFLSNSVVSTASTNCSPWTSSCTQRRAGGCTFYSGSEEQQSRLSWNLQAFRRGITGQPSSVKHRPSTVCFAKSDLASSASKSKIAALTIKDVTIGTKSQDEKNLKIRVDISGEASKRAFDSVLKDLAKNAPPVPGFRKAKGGKTSMVPLQVLYQMMGPKLVRKFVVDEVIKATLQQHMLKEGIKAKEQFTTDQSSEELSTLFEAGKPFGFDATLEFVTDEPASETDGTTPVAEEVGGVKQEMEESVSSL